MFLKSQFFLFSIIPTVATVWLRLGKDHGVMFGVRQVEYLIMVSLIFKKLMLTVIL